MTEPTRLKVLKALTAEIERRANLEGRVFRGRDYASFSTGDPVPFITIMEQLGAGYDDPLQSQDGRARVLDLPLEIIGIAEKDADNPTDPVTLLMYQVIAAIRGILKDGRLPEGERDILGLGKAVDRIIIGVGKVLPEGADLLTNVAFFSLMVRVVFVDD